MSAPMRVRDITQEWCERSADRLDGFFDQSKSHPNASDALRALAVAVKALREHDGVCEHCDGVAHFVSGTGEKKRYATCPHCDGTGSNAARRALDTTINGGKS